MSKKGRIRKQHTKQLEANDVLWWYANKIGNHTHTLWVKLFICLWWWYCSFVFLVSYDWYEWTSEEICECTHFKHWYLLKGTWTVLPKYRDMSPSPSPSWVHSNRKWYTKPALFGEYFFFHLPMRWADDFYKYRYIFMSIFVWPILIYICCWRLHAIDQKCIQMILCNNNNNNIRCARASIQSITYTIFNVMIKFNLPTAWSIVNLGFLIRILFNINPIVVDDYIINWPLLVGRDAILKFAQIYSYKLTL